MPKRASEGCQRVCTQDRSIPAEWRRRREHIRIICGAIFPTDKRVGALESSCGLVSQPIVQQAYFSAISSPIESSSASMIFKPVSGILTTSVTHDSNFV